MKSKNIINRKFFTLLEAIIAIVIMSVLSVSVVYIFKDSNSEDDIKARSSLLSAKGYLDATVGNGGISSLADITSLNSDDNNLVYTNNSSNNSESIAIEVSVEFEKYNIAVYNSNGGCWLLSRKFNVETANEASVFGYKATESCNATLADQLVSGSEYGSIEKPIIL
jgi:type II secretory pathway pseudopilin PulG